MLLCILTTYCVTVENYQSDFSTLEEIKIIMKEYFYDQSKLPAFFARLENIKNNFNNNWIYDLKHLLNELNVSHLGFYMPDELEYYEQMDIYKFGHEDKHKRLFPPDGIIRYPGIGIVPRLINGRYFVDMIYANTPAYGIDILPGDELLTVDGQSYNPINSFRNKIGQKVTLAIRREPDGSPLECEAIVEYLNPTETFISSTSASVRIIEHYGSRIGYIRLISFTDAQVGQILNNTLSGTDFASVDALILDIRGRWGGAPLDAAEIFVGGTPNVAMVMPTGTVFQANFRWTKPMVAIIGHETRSGLEILAYSLKKAGIPLVGSNTRGAIIGGRAFILEDNSFFLIPVAEITVDGQRLEGIGVAPTFPVDFVLEYSQGYDPQLELAINKTIEIINING